jgi:hypothetical protein
MRPLSRLILEVPAILNKLLVIAKAEGPSGLKIPPAPGWIPVDA